MSMWSSREVGLGFGAPGRAMSVNFSLTQSAAAGTKNATILHNTWPELGLFAESKDGTFLGGILEAEAKREVPPQMAVSNRNHPH